MQRYSPPASWRFRACVIVALALITLATASVAQVDAVGAADGSGQAAPLPAQAMPADDVGARVLALDCSSLSPADVRDVLRRTRAPRIIALQGSIAFVTMQPFAAFLVDMGYPEAQLRNPRDGSLSYGSFGASEELAGKLAWYYEREGMMPMLIGHSQGGALAIKVLHELAGAFRTSIAVWNPVLDAAEARTTIVDPRTGNERPVMGLTVPYVAAIATGKLPRVLLGQWNMITRLRQIPDTVEDFTGFTLEWDPIAGTFPGSEPYRSMDVAHVRNVTLPGSASHITLPRTQDLARRSITAVRSWIDAYFPGTSTPMPASPNILHAADIWYSVKQHWCIESQRRIRARESIDEGAHG